MHAAGHAVLVFETAMFITSVAWQVLRRHLLISRLVLNIAASCRQDIKSGRETSIKVSSFVLALDKDHLGQTKPLSSTNKKRPWTEFRQSLSSFLVGRELLSPLFQIRGCSRLTMNSASPSSLNGPNCKCVRWLERLPDGGKILNLPAGPKICQRKQKYKRKYEAST